MTKVNTSQRGPWIIGLLAFCSLFFGIGGWMAYANLSGAIVAVGSVVVQGQLKKVQHVDGGAVAALHVENGTFVEEGHVLVELDPTNLEANRQIFISRLRDALARKARLIAEREDSDQIRWQDKFLHDVSIEPDEAIRLGQQKLFTARKAARLGQVKQLNERISQLKRQIEGQDALIQSKQNRLALLLEELVALQKLRKKKLVNVSTVLTHERRQEDILGQIAEHHADIARLTDNITEVEIQILQVDHEALEEILSQLQAADLEASEMAQQLHATSEQLKRITIRAPASGIVHELNVSNVGGVITPGADIMTIVPQNSELEVAVDVEPQYVDDVHVGQDARVRLSAYDQRSTPELVGYVKLVSANSVINEQTGRAFYRVLISMPESELKKLNGKTLIPGMPVEAFIRTIDHTPLDYVLKPLTDHLRHALRES